MRKGTKIVNQTIPPSNLTDLVKPFKQSKQRDSPKTFNTANIGRHQ